MLDRDARGKKNLCCKAIKRQYRREGSHKDDGGRAGGGKQIFSRPHSIPPLSPSSDIRDFCFLILQRGGGGRGRVDLRKSRSIIVPFLFFLFETVLAAFGKAPTLLGLVGGGNTYGTITRFALKRTLDLRKETQRKPAIILERGDRWSTLPCVQYNKCLENLLART